MEYQKYLKYKTKYLQLKAKLTQLGGGAKCYHNRNNAKDIKTTQLRNKPSEEKDWVDPPIILEDLEEVDVIQTKNEFGLVKTVNGEGWVRMAYLFNKDPKGNIRKCIFFSKKETLGQTPPRGHAAMPSSASSGTAASSKTAEQMLSSSNAVTSYGCTHDFCRAHANITGVHAILVVKDNNGTSGVLLGKERDGIYRGQYNMFGGSKDLGDCILSCLYREISEEARFLRIDKSINWENFVKIFMDNSGNFYGNRIHHTTSAVFIGVIRQGNLFFDAQGTLPVGTLQVYDGNSSNLVRDINTTFITLITRGVKSQYCEMDDVILFDPASPPLNISDYARSNIRHLLGQIQKT